MYNLLTREKKNQVTSVINWREKGYDMNEFDWGNISELPFKVTLESKIQTMQYQILNWIVRTNNYLYKIKLKDSSLCSFCKLNIETIENLYTECPEVKDIWYRIEELFLTKYKVSFVFDKRSILFGKYNNNKLYRVQNLLILIVNNTFFPVNSNLSKNLTFLV